MLEDENFSLKQQLEKFKSMYAQEKSERETLEIKVNEYKLSHKNIETDLQNMKENRDMMRDLGKDLEKENCLLKNKMEQIHSRNSELSTQLSESHAREESAKKSLKNS
jgi:chromosome segregation ATPase